VWASGRIRHDGTGERAPWGDAWRRAMAAVRQGGVRRWLLLLELADLLGDMLAGYVALYLVDVAGASPARAAVGVALWTGSELVGGAALVPLLKRVPGPRYLRATAVLALSLYPAFLLTPGLGSKLTLLGALGLVRAGWYPVLTARLYEELPGASGTAMGLSSLAGLVGQTVPLAIGAAAGAFGLGPAMWLLLAAPAALLVGVPRVATR
ncbi:MAG TPA: MFS transporter, partial [Actinomycetota bacterium]|nr:MFS transporter [Actinomycetota bacterium]